MCVFVYVNIYICMQKDKHCALPVFINPPVTPGDSHPCAHDVLLCSLGHELSCGYWHIDNNWEDSLSVFLTKSQSIRN